MMIMMERNEKKNRFMNISHNEQQFPFTLEPFPISQISLTTSANNDNPELFRVHNDVHQDLEFFFAVNLM